MFSCKKIIHSTKKKIRNNVSIQKIVNKKNRLLDWVEIHPWKTLIITYFVFVGMKIAFSLAVLSPVAPSDEYRYLKVAQSFWHGQGFQINGIPSHHTPPLYPITISPAYIFNDMMHVAAAISVINSIVSSLVILPAFLISREFLDKKNSIVIAILVSISCCGIYWFFKILSQNLWCPLILFTLYILYKAAFERGYKFKILGGVFVGLCFLTKYNSIVLFPFILIIFLINSFFIKNGIKNKLFKFADGLKDALVIGLISVIVITPWFIRNGSIFGYTIKGILGYTSELNYADNTIDYIVTIFGFSKSGSSHSFASTLPGDILIQTIIHNGFIIYACGFIFFVLSLIMLYRSLKNKEYKILLFSIMTFLLAEFLILLTAWHDAGGHNTWRLLHHYVQPAIMPFIILGYIGLIHIRRISNRNALLLIILCSIPLIFLLKSLFASLSQNLSIVGLITNVVEPFFWIVGIVSLVIIFTTFMYFIRNKPLKNRKYVILLACLLIISFTMFTSIKYVNRKCCEIPTHPLNDVGKWMNIHASGTNDLVFFDKNIGFKAESPMYAPPAHFVGSWINAPMIVEDLNNNTKNCRYLISFEQFDYETPFNRSIPIRSSNDSSTTQHQILYIYLINNGSKLI